MPLKSLKPLMKTNYILEKILHLIAAYIVTAAIALFSIIAILYWQPYFSIKSGNIVEIQSAQETALTLLPSAAEEALKSTPLVSYKDTELIEESFWLRFNVPAQNADNPYVIEFPSRHSISLTCWQSPSFFLLGRGNRLSTEGSIYHSKAGFALKLGPSEYSKNILCRVLSIGPSRLTVLTWKTNDLTQSEMDFRRHTGLLDGGMFVLCIFVLLTALINRSGLYLLFATWLAVNLRMAELSIGADTQWMGSMLPLDIIPRMRLITTSIYYLITAALFSALFKDYLKTLGNIHLFRAAQWTCLPMLLISITLD